MNRPSMHAFRVLCSLALIAISGTAISQPGSGASGKEAAISSPVLTSHTAMLNGKVTAVNLARRTVEIESDGGQALRLFVGPDVKNFNTVKVGDRVAARFTEAVAIALEKVPGKTDDLGSIRSKVESLSAMQPPAGTPGVGMVDRTTMVANVFDVDREHGTVTLRGTTGIPVKIRVTDPKALQQIDKNDKVLMSYVESVAVSIQPSANGTASMAH